MAAKKEQFREKFRKDGGVETEEEALEEENVPGDVVISKDTADSGEDEAVSSSDEDEKEDEMVRGMEMEFGD